MSDYKVLKEQSVVNRNEVETLRTYVFTYISYTADHMT